jgi:hypothetical protein
MLLAMSFAPHTASAESLVDCTNPAYQSSNSAMSLFSWSSPLHDEAVAASNAGNSPSSSCEKLLSQRGAAHCKEPANDMFREALAASLAVCGASDAPAAPASPPPSADVATDAPSSGDTTDQLVDCSQPAYQSSSSAPSLYGWSAPLYEDAEISLRRDGVFPTALCEELLAKRGAAHCKDPSNAQFREGLQQSLALCTRAAAPVVGGVDCAIYRDEEVPHRTLLNWTKNAMHNLSAAPGEALSVRCQEVEGYAQRAVCQVPSSTEAQQALSDVRTACAAEVARRNEAAEAAARRHAEWLAKKASERVISSPPQSQFTGGSRAAVEQQMARALIASRIAKRSDDLIRVQAQSGWQTGRFTDTKLQYRKATGIAIWKSQRGDDVCRYTSYNFTQIWSGDGWGTLGFRSFCNGCAEGWMRCP